MKTFAFRVRLFFNSSFFKFTFRKTPRRPNLNGQRVQKLMGFTIAGFLATPSTIFSTKKATTHNLPLRYRPTPGSSNLFLVSIH